jgi:hypothetical protein
MRELRRRCPENVAILPSAAERQVKQTYSLAYQKARRELKASQGIEFPYQLPFHRAAERAEREARRYENSPHLRPDVPPFNPRNPAHLRAWETIFDMGRQLLADEDR